MSASEGNSEEVFTFRWEYESATEKTKIDSDETDEETQLPEEEELSKEERVVANDEVTFERMEAPRLCESFLKLRPSELNEHLWFYLLDGDLSIAALDPPVPTGPSTATKPLSVPVAPPSTIFPIRIQPLIQPRDTEALYKTRSQLSVPSNRMNPLRSTSAKPASKPPTKSTTSPPPLRSKKDKDNKCQTGKCDSSAASPLICCDSCKVWVHVQCQGLDSEEATQLSAFVCKSCCKEEKERRRAKKKEVKEQKRRKKEKKRQLKEKKYKKQKKKQKIDGSSESGSSPSPSNRQPLNKICFNCRNRGCGPIDYLNKSFARFCKTCSLKLQSLAEQRKLLQAEAATLSQNQVG